MQVMWYTQGIIPTKPDFPPMNQEAIVNFIGCRKTLMTNYYISWLKRSLL